jgi:hypothetical protein
MFSKCHILILDHTLLHELCSIHATAFDNCASEVANFTAQQEVPIYPFVYVLEGIRERENMLLVVVHVNGVRQCL